MGWLVLGVIVVVAVVAIVRRRRDGTADVEMADPDTVMRLEMERATAVETLKLTRERLTVRAPRAGRVDALPFKPGDQPPVGAELVSMLVGDTPYARVFVPAPQRPQLAIGSRFEVHVQGVDTPFPATLRSIRSEPSFTPYYALAGDDASRLVYRAELVLEGEGVADLPAGLPLTAVPIDGGG